MAFLVPDNTVMISCAVVNKLDLATHDAVEKIRRNIFGGTAKAPLKHLGESETLHAIHTLPTLGGSTFLSDDEDAGEHARHQGIPSLTTCDVLRAICADGDLTAAAAFELMNAMADKERALLRMPGSQAWFSG